MFNINEILNQINKDKIIKHALEDIENEICGLIIQHEKSYIIFQCRNIHSDKQHNVIIHPEDYLSASFLGKIIGFYHSHKEQDYLSNKDITSSINNNLICVMFCIKTNNFFVFNPFTQKHKYKNYLNKKFDFNDFNCYTLVKDFYKNEFNIDFPNYKINEEWHKKEKNKINNEYDKIFNKILKETTKPKEGDIIIFKFFNFSNHLAIYLNEKEFLHVPRNKFSTIENYTEIFKLKTDKILTYES